MNASLAKQRLLGGTAAERMRAELQEKVQRGETVHSPVRRLSDAERAAYEAQLLAREAKASTPVARVPRPTTSHLLRPPARYRSPPAPLSAEERAERFASRRSAAAAESETACAPANRLPDPAAPAAPAVSSASCSPAGAPPPAPTSAELAPANARAHGQKGSNRRSDTAQRALSKKKAAPGPTTKPRGQRKPRATSRPKTGAVLRVVAAELNSFGGPVRPIAISLTRNIPLVTVEAALEQLVAKGEAKVGRQGTYLAVRRPKR